MLKTFKHQNIKKLKNIRSVFIMTGLNLVGQLTNEVEVFGKETLRGAVAYSILENADINGYKNADSAVMDFMEDVMQYGCVSGTVSDMIYYVDTLKFYDQFESYIKDMVIDYGMDDVLEKMGMIADCEADEDMEELYDMEADYEKNNIAWMAYELIVSDLHNEFDNLLAI
jgi:hypothetical protein